MKNLILLFLVLFTLNSCMFEYRQRVELKTKAGTFTCAVEGKNKVASTVCDFVIDYKDVLWSCSIALVDIKKNWEPSVDVGCEVIADLAD